MSELDENQAEKSALHLPSLKKKRMANLNELHKEHLEWLSQLDFFQDEIKFFQNKLLGLILEEHHSLREEEHVAEYRELFFLQLKRIDDLRHHVLAHEQMIKREGRESFPKEHDHEHLSASMANLEQNLMDLRQKFKHFASHQH